MNDPHRARVFAAFSRHSDPLVREIGRLLAKGAPTTPTNTVDELRQRVFGPTVPLRWPEEPEKKPTGPAGACSSHRAGPASRAEFTDPDNGAGGVPAIRR